MRVVLHSGRSQGVQRGYFAPRARNALVRFVRRPCRAFIHSTRAAGRDIAIGFHSTRAAVTSPLAHSSRMLARVSPAPAARLWCDLQRLHGKHQTPSGSTKWSLWLGRQHALVALVGDAPDSQLTGYTEISPAGGLSYGSGRTAANQVTFENSNFALKREASGDYCDAGAVFKDIACSGTQSWATSQDNDHFGTVVTLIPA